MNSYYYAGHDCQPYGPIEASQLKNYGVTRETLVWCDGMENWAKAGDVPELAPLFTNMPPPIPGVPSAPMPGAPGANTGSVVYVNQPASQEQSNGCGVAGLVFSIIGLFTSFVPVLSWVIWFLGFLLSLIGVFKEPRGTAIAGLVISLLGVIIIVTIVGGAIGALGAASAFM